jgi:hypothetical protein
MRLKRDFSGENSFHTAHSLSSLSAELTTFKINAFAFFRAFIPKLFRRLTRFDAFNLLSKQKKKAFRRAIQSLNVTLVIVIKNPAGIVFAADSAAIIFEANLKREEAKRIIEQADTMLPQLEATIVDNYAQLQRLAGSTALD